MLILFDIDGTLLLTQGAGMMAMQEAGRELYGDHFDTSGLDFSGQLDSWIWNELARRNDIASSEKEHHRFRAAYGRHLACRLSRQNTARLLPGVRELVMHLSQSDRAFVGLLTGNYPETGRLKIHHAGMDPDLFTVAAWGIDGPTRNDLPPVAIRRHHERTGRLLAGDNVVIIGDTPHDVACAKAHGCRAIGVATGHTSVEELFRCGADLAVPSLQDLDCLSAFIFRFDGTSR